MKAWTAVEDMWHIYNLVRPGDLVTAKTFRKVTNISAGSNSSERVVIKLTVRVEANDFDPIGTPLVYGMGVYCSFCHDFFTAWTSRASSIS